MSVFLFFVFFCLKVEEEKEKMSLLYGYRDREGNERKADGAKKMMGE